MGFASSEFIFLLPLAVLLYYLAPIKMRQYCLLVINGLFLWTFGWAAILLIFCETVVAYITALSCGRGHSEKAKNAITATGVVLLLGTLLFFKFGALFSESIIAPIGISFYTLQAVSYILDVRSNKRRPERKFFRLLTWLSFFATVTSGPIYRYKDYRKSWHRIEKSPKPEYYRIIAGIIYLLYGYFLRLVISARVGMIAEKVFGDYREIEYGGGYLLAAMIAYSIQIYTDFAGYSAIVIGIAKVLGFEIPDNFKMPYLSTSIKEFWGRWHISFSSWLKDYVYIPLGGNRKGNLRKHLNVFATFLVSGLWHGVNLHFLIWGALHGVLRVFEDILPKPREERHGIVSSLKRILIFLIVSVIWLFFRMNASEAINFLRQIWIAMPQGIPVEQFVNLGLANLDWIVLGIALAALFICDELQYRKDIRFDRLVLSRAAVTRCAIVIVLALTILIFGVYGPQHDASYFIYRDF